MARQTIKGGDETRKAVGGKVKGGETLDTSRGFSSPNYSHDDKPDTDWVEGG